MGWVKFCPIKNFLWLYCIIMTELHVYAYIHCTIVDMLLHGSGSMAQCKPALVLPLRYEQMS